MNRTALLVSVAILALGQAFPALAQDSAPDAASNGLSASTEEAGGLQDIVVTAQKRSETANTVGMSITALKGDALVNQGVTSPADLVKVVPGFTFTKGVYASPVYTLRGVGFYDNQLSSPPTVSVYVDEVPLPYSRMTVGTTLDLERVEVLKGPQGTLFGNNSTGGALNFIAAKPTDVFHAGVTASYGRFNRYDLEGFVSGPLTGTVNARLAVRTEQGDDWQKSQTRQDSLGKSDRLFGRLLLDWNASDALKFELNLNGWRDKSDSQAAQFYATTPVNPATVDPRLVTYPLPKQDNRIADWDPNTRFKSNNRFYQASLRGDLDLGDDVSVTSITAFSRLQPDYLFDLDGTAIKNIVFRQAGYVQSLSQELRIQGEFGRDSHWVVGGNFQSDRSHDLVYGEINGSNVGTADYRSDSKQRVKTYAGFANVDYAISDTITLQGGLRYTQANRSVDACTFDGGSGALAGVVGGLASALRGSTVAVAPGACLTLGPQLLPEIYRAKLNQNNLTWRAGINWKPAAGTLLYANISRGYKAGSFPQLVAIFQEQYAPVTQESILAYEAGFKLTLLDRTLQLNGAVFYYDYSDKQVSGRTPVPLIGNVENLVNIPKSRVLGAELQVNWAPIEGLRLNGGLSYAASRIARGTTGFDPYGAVVDLSGEPFPRAPKWQGSADGEYDWRVSERWMAFAGANMTYQSATNGGLGELPVFDIDPYTLIDLRVGLRRSDDKLRITAWVRNLTDKYYYSNSTIVLDTVARYTGQPRTYGLSAAFRY